MPQLRDPATDALTKRLLEIRELAARGDPAFQPGSAFFQTRVGGAVQTALGGASGINIEDLWSRLSGALQSAFASQASSDAAALGLQRELGLKELALKERGLDITERGQEVSHEEYLQTFAEGKRQFGLTFGLEKERFQFEKQDVITQRLMEAAQLATGPAGAIQLAHMARGEGAPQSQILNIFQNLPFVRAATRGEALPGFGVPEQLGGASQRTSGKGGAQFAALPGLGGYTEQMYQGMSDFEKVFLGSLYQAEKGIPVDEALAQIRRSFIPTTPVRAVGVG